MSSWRVRGCPRLLVVCLVMLAGLGADLAAGKGRFARHELMVGDVVREYFVYTPGTLAAGPHPTVLAFHGFASDASGFRWLIGPDAEAAQHGFLIVYPSAIGGSFNAGRGEGSRNRTSDDLSFVARLVDVLPVRHQADATRIFAMGFSNGAQLAALLACHHGEKLKALAMVAHTLNVDPCAIDTPLAAVVIHGAKDPMVPFEGGGPHAVASHHETVDFFRQLNRTGDSHHSIVDLATIRCRNYDQGSADVVSCVAFDSGHSWPGGRELMVEKLGKVNRELDATAFVMRFFARQTGDTSRGGEGGEQEDHPLWLRRSVIPLVEEIDEAGGRGGLGGVS